MENSKENSKKKRNKNEMESTDIEKSISMEPKPKRHKTNRLQGRIWFLTYSQTEYSKQETLNDIIDKLSTKLIDLKEWVICQETHKDGGHHIHCLLKLNKQLELYSNQVNNWWNINNRSADQKVIKCNNKKEIIDKINYCLKEDNSPIISEGFIKLNSYKNNIEAIKKSIELAKEGKINEALNIQIDNNPRDYILYGNNIQSNLEKLNNKNDYTMYDIQSFNIPEKIQNWLNNYSNHYVLWIKGPTGIGKTSLAMSLFDKPLLIRHKEGLKKLKDHDVLVFDDMNFNNGIREEAIHLTDMKQPSEINVKHGSITIPKGMKRIFCSNVDIWPTDYSGALRRRVYTVKLDNKLLYKNNNKKNNTPPIPEDCYMYEKKDKNNIDNNNMEDQKDCSEYFHIELICSECNNNTSECICD